jgi:hypothetical protein
MRVKLILLLPVVTFFILSSFVSSQNWYPLGAGLTSWHDGRVLYFDSTANLLYAGGAFDSAGGIRTNGIAVWNGSVWDSLGHGADFGAPVYNISEFNGQLIASSIFFNTPPDYKWLNVWSGSDWDTMSPNIDGVAAVIKEMNGELYLGGGFGFIGNTPASLVAKYDGTNWITYPLNSDEGGFIVSAIEFYNGQMYVGGNFFDSINQINDLEYWDGTSFHGIGGGLPFGGASIHSMTVFQNELYLAGEFTTPSGHNIMKWNGTSFSDVGGGTDYPIVRIKVFNGELYACGAFNHAGNISASKMAKWNGNTWSQVYPDSINQVVADFIFANGAMYITGAFTQVGSVTAFGVAKFTGLSGYSDVFASSINFSLGPNPSHSILKIFFSSPLSDELFALITNATGKEYFQFTIPKLTAKKEIDIGELAQGIYFISLQSQMGSITRKLIKQ